MDTRRIQVSYSERMFPGQTTTLFSGPLDEAPSVAVIREPILQAVRRGETQGKIVRDGITSGDKGACQWSWWIADDGRDETD